ncbi:hypothetical protein IDG99_01605 [Pelagibacterales bacterium SAG-MED09]|nr:hypothetical protein [Pelagibacterales bacterium SAG-MED09]
MKNTISSIKDKIAQKYTLNDETSYSKKSTDINILLNRVKEDQKKESRKKILFTAATSAGILLFGFLIF